MNFLKDYYAVLGVLPSAEDIVIRAAYRALAQRYHPDRHDDSNATSNERMAELNEAYAILSSSTARAEYDRLRGSGAKSADAYFNEAEPEAPPSVDPLDKDWQLAVSYYPDLPLLEARLAKVSWRLAYSYRAYILESKQFEQRAEFANIAETQFLKTYFGENQQIVDFARDLIRSGQRSAAKALNEACRVLGSNVDAAIIIRRITNDYFRHAVTEAARKQKDLVYFAETIINTPNLPIREKVAFFSRMGGEFLWGTGLFSSSCSAKFQGFEHTFTDGQAFEEWIITNIAPEFVGKKA